jgi:hypothetical protein
MMKHTRTRVAAALASAAFIGVTATSAAGAAGAADAAAPAAAARQTRQIASSQLGQDYRITLTALRSTSDRYAASVRLQVFEPNRAGKWKETDRVRVGAVDGWFWFPLTGKGAICRFSTASTEPAPVAVSLLVTPSIGCSAAAHYEIRDGRIHATAH